MTEGPVLLKIYSKADCPLCDELIALAERLRSKEHFDLEVVKIDGQPELLGQYGGGAPVGFVNGRRTFEGSVDETELLGFLRKARRSRGRQGQPQIRSLDMLEAGAGPSTLVWGLVIMALSLLTAGYFLVRGFQEKAAGRERLVASLFEVEARNTTPLPFDLEEIRGTRLKLSDLSGKVLFVNFWATWCPPCLEELPSMMRFYEKMSADPNFGLVAISADDSWDPVKGFFQSSVPGFPVLLDAKGKLANQYGTEKFPETYVIVDGKIRGFIMGPRDWDSWYAEAYARELLRNRGPSAARVSATGDGAQVAAELAAE